MTAQVVPNNFQFLAGGGEMGKLMRAHDWSKSPVGDPSAWPEPLRTTLALVLNSKFPMFIFWGEELVGFYNDAYRPSLGNNGKHPSILGMPGEAAWPEIWHIIKPLIDSVFATGEATWSEDQLIPIYRNGKIEDVYWTFSYSPIKEHSGRICGILVTCTETTGKMLTLQKLEEAENRFRNSLLQAPTAIVILRGENYIVELANDPYLQLIDRTREAFIGRPLLDSLPEVKSTIGTLLKGVMETGIPYYGNELEVPIKRHGRIENCFFNFVYQPLREPDDSISGIMVVVNEVTSQVHARHVLLESETQFRNMVMQSPIPMTIFSGPDHIIDIANTQMIHNIWRKKESDLIGKKALEVFPELNNQKYPALLKRVMETREPYRESESIAYVQGDDGLKKFYLDFEYAPVLEPSGNVYGIMITVNDVTEKVTAREKIEESENALSMAISVTGLGTWNYTPQTGVLNLSQECRKIFAVPEGGEISLEDFAARILPEDKPLVTCAVKEAVNQADKNPSDIIFRISRFDNLVRWIHLKGKASFTPEGQPEKFYGTALDITDDKKAEEELARMAAIVQSSEDAIISKTLGGIVTSWNTAAERVFGYSSEEMIGESIMKLLPEDRFGEEVNIIDRISRGERVEHFETKRVKKDGSLIDLSISISPIRDASGKILGASKIARDITKQKIVEQDLQESEVRLRLATEGTRLATWDLNLLTREIFHSPRMAEIFGHPLSKQLQHAELREQVHEEDRATIVEKAFAEAMKTGIYFYEARVVKPGNSIAWIRTQGKVIFDEQHQPVRMIGTLMDITETKNTIATLEESRLRQNIAIEAAELGTWELDLVTKDVIYSPRYLEIMGFRSDETPAHTDLLKHIHPDDIHKRDQAMDQALKTGVLDIEMRVLTNKTATLRWVIGKGRVLYDAAGKPVKIIGTLEDITEQKLYQKNLKDSEEKFRLLADSMPQNIWTSDAFGNFNYFNRSVYDFSGLPHSKVDKDGWLQIVHPDDREESVKKWMEAVKSGEPFLLEHRFKRSDGEYRWQLSRAIPQQDAKGQIQMWVGTSTDIDELKKHEQQKDDFIKMASHELKTPITTVKGYVQLLLKTHGAGHDTFLSSSLLTIDKQILKLTKLISELLDVTKIETGSLDLVKEKFLIGDVIVETAKDIDAAHSSHSIVISQHANPEIFADRDRISQVLSNLFTNAIKYSPKADKIMVTVDQTETDVVVEVQDFGIGIAAADQPKIFERFFRAAGKDEKTFPGFGIGLFIVNEILSLHHGKIWVKSEKDKGSSFYFTLPLSPK